MFQNFPTIPAPAVPGTPPSLVMGMKLKVPSIWGQDESDYDSSDALFDTKANNTFFDDNDKTLTCTHIYKNRRSTHSPSWQRLSDLLALQSRVSEADDLFAFPVLRNVNAQGQLIPQYEGIDFSHMKQMEKTVTMYGLIQFSHSVVSDSLRPHESQHTRPPCPSPTPGVHSDSRPLSQWCHPAISSGLHSPFTKELLNTMTSSTGNFIPYDWRILIKALFKPGEYCQWIMWFHDVAWDHANSTAQSGAPQNQITFEMLTGMGQFDSVEAQIRCPPLLHKQLKEFALEAWDRIISQGEPKGSYTKILQGPNEAYADFLARLGVAISCSIVGEEARVQLKSCLHMRMWIRNVREP